VSSYEPAPLQLVTRQSWYPWLVVGLTCIGGFMGQLDASIVQLALPTFERQFDANLDAVSWVAIAYLLAFAATLPIFARLSETKGRKLFYLAGYAIFTLASGWCGMVDDLRLLIVFRAIQGIGGAMLGANSITIMVRAAGPLRRGRAMGLIAAAQAVGVSAGPVIGGLLLENFGWRWIFFVSVPFGLAGVILGWLALPQTPKPASTKRFDWWGAFLLTPGLTSVVLMLNEVQAWGLRSAAMLSAALVAAVFIPLFLWREWRQAEPLVDLHLFLSSAFSGGLAAVNLSYALLYSMFFLMSFLFIHGLNESPIVAGIHLAVIPIALGLVAPISGGIYRRVGARTMTTSAMGLCLGALVAKFGRSDGKRFWCHGCAHALRRRAGHVHSAEQQRDHGRRSRKANRRGGRHAESDASPGLHDWHRGRFGCIFMASLCFDGARQQDHRRAGTSDIGGRRRSAMGPRWLCRRGGELCSLARLRHPPCLERVR